LLKAVRGVFSTSDKSLKENQEQGLSAFLLSDGRIEGVYLGIDIIDSVANPKGIYLLSSIIQSSRTT
jgi:hypothetical protein